MNKKLGQEPAFPHDEYGYINEDMPCNLIESHNGMSKRFYAACAAMQGLLANPYLMESVSKEVKNAEQARFFVVRSSYQYADELLKQENNE